MMKIKIHGYLTIKKAMGNRSSFELETEGSTIKNILKEFKQRDDKYDSTKIDGSKFDRQNYSG